MPTQTPTARRAPPTVESVKDGLTKLLHQTSQLQKEVGDLRATIGRFTAGRDIHPPIHFSGLEHYQRPKTDEPKSAILEIRWELRSTDNLEAPTRALLAIAKDLDGCFRDVRATRADIEAIRDDGDLRAEFKSWKDDQSGR